MANGVSIFQTTEEILCKLNNGELVTCHKQHIVLFFSLSYLFLFYFGEKYFTQIHGGT